MLKLLTVAFCYLAVTFSSPPEEFICVRSKNPVVIDAKADEWKDARSIEIADELKRSDNRVSISTMWDEDNLYFLFNVCDRDLQATQTVRDHPRLYLDDMVEFLVDPHNKKDSCWSQDDIIYHINILGQKKDDRGSDGCLTNAEWNGDAEYAVVIDGTLNDASDIDKGYVVEIKIAWREIGIRPFTGLVMGANLAVGDNGRLFDWVDAAPFRSPYAFGNLILSD